MKIIRQSSQEHPPVKNDLLNLFPLTEDLDDVDEVGKVKEIIPVYDDEFSLDNIVSVDLEDGKQPEGLKIDDNASEVTTTSEADQLVFSLLAEALNKETDTISFYRSVMDNFSMTDVNRKEFNVVVKDILSDCYRHIGQLQLLQKLLDPNMKLADEGVVEAQEQLSDVLHPLTVIPAEATPVIPEAPKGGFQPLKVPTMPQAGSASSQNNQAQDECSGNDICTVVQIDDEF